MKGKEMREYQKKVIIVNDGLGPNLGDQAILHSMLVLLQSALPHVFFQTFPNSDMRTFHQYLAFWRALKQSDLLIFGGGQEIQDQASVVFLISGLLKIVLAYWTRIPVMCYAIGVGPLKTNIGRLLARFVLNRVTSLSVRDEESKRQLLELGIKNVSIEVTADPALFLNPEIPKRICGNFEWPEGTGPRIIITPRRWYHYRHYFLPMQFRAKLFPLYGQKQFEWLQGEIAHAADVLIRQVDAQIVLCPMRSSKRQSDPGQDDDQVCSNILEVMSHRKNVCIWREANSPEELKGAFKKADLVIGMRMHSLMFAAMLGIPIIAISILSKHKAFLQQVGQETFCIDPDQLTCQMLIESVFQVFDSHRVITRHLYHQKNRLQLLLQRDVDQVARLLKTNDQRVSNVRPPA